MITTISTYWNNQLSSSKETTFCSFINLKFNRSPCWRFSRWCQIDSSS